MAYDQQTADLIAENRHLRQALEDIANPIAAMKRMADAKGAQLSGWAYSISRDPDHLQSIARKALTHGQL